ncbi:unnamed protein product [Candidula unifasciata]|uniref:Genetic suppressor element-like domain-containing protein n=1 Tax=Candidula unifasciata TaxID=100452 RepID=A0A8S3ZIR8_9EUPU|nr:unnamed protein product [Candidula unifasciata]
MPSRIVCFVCGSLGGEYQLRSRPYEGCAFFPFLEHHEPPKGSRLPGADGTVDSCRVCYAFLTQQWETYEHANTPAIKRLYWLKRLDDGQFTGAEMKLQGEYMAQVMGLQYQPSCGDSCAPGSPDSRDGSGTGAEPDVRLDRKSQTLDDGDHVLDLSVPLKSDLAQISNRSTPAADKSPREATRMRPQLDDFSFLCYICGDENEGVAAKCISSIAHGVNKPFFPFLNKLTPHKGAAQLNGQGICQVCDRCFSSLCHQWLTYEHHGTPNSARIYKVNAQFFSNDSSIALGLAPDALSASGEVCYLCSRSWASSKVCSLFTAPASTSTDHMYFPFIRELRRPHGARPLNPDGSVLVCVSCYSNLQDQWQRYEAEKVPFLQRRYSLLPSSSSASSVTSQSLKSFADPDIKCDPGVLKVEVVTKSLTQPLAIEISKSATCAKTQAPSLPSGATSYSSAVVGASGSNQATAPESSKHHGTESKSHSSSTILSIPHPLQQAGERPKKVCFLCGQKCLLSKAQILYSYPVRHETKSAGGQCQTIPFFPFLASQPPAPGSEPMAEEGTVISCSYCFYSLLNQWRDFEESKGVTDRNRWLRKYTLNEFVCYVCGMMVARKKMRTLEVQKFLFLREHKAPANALVMWGGEGVGVCGSCHYSLSHQFTEFERLGLPMELRKYNWTVQHHTEENSNDAHDSNHGMSSAAINEDSNLSVADGADDSNHSSAPSTKPVFSLASPAAHAGKPSLKSALVLPQSRMSPSSNGLTSSSHNLSLSTSRSAGFAAALRNLAHQMKEPCDDGNENSLTSPTNQNSRSNTPKRSQASLLLPSHTANNSFTAPPVVTVAPTQTSMFQGVTSFSLGQERSHTSTFEPWSKPDPDLPSLSTADSELIGKDLLLSRTSARVPAPRSISASGVPVTSQMLYARNFPAYHPEEEELIRHGLTLPYGIDPAAYAAAASAYHPALLQQQAAFAQGSLRLGDTLLLDQYRMLQSPYLQFPAAAGLISPHSLGLGMHSVLAAAAASQHYPPGLFPQHYPYLSFGQPVMDPHTSAQAVAMERSWLDAEKARDKRDREKTRHQEHSSEKENSHRRSDSRGEQDLIKKEVNINSEGFGHGSLERKSTPCVSVCQSSRSPELLSRQFSESHNGHPASRPTSSLSASSGHRPVAKMSPGASSQATEASTHPGLSSASSHASLRSHSSTLPSRGLTFKPYEKLYESSQPSSQPVLDQHQPHSHHQGSTLPPWMRSSTSSSSKSSHDKNKNPDFTPLFRPFDDHKDTVEFPSTAAQSVHPTHRQWSFDSSSPMLPFQFTGPDINSTAVDSSGGLNNAHSRTSPLLSLNKDSSFVPKNYARKQAENGFNDRIKRFDFKSLANECTASASVHRQPSVNSDILPTTAESRQFLSKLDFEAARAKERKKRGEDTDSDSEKDKEERMRVRLTMVGRATPIPLDTSPPKMEFLENLGLTSWKKKKELNRQKEIRRRRQLRLSSISPLQQEADSSLGFCGDSMRSLNHHSTHSASSQEAAVSPEDKNTEVDLGDKSEFVTRLGLMSVTEQQTEVHGGKRKLNEDESPSENLPQKKGIHETSEAAAACLGDDSRDQLHENVLSDSQRLTQHQDTSSKTLLYLDTPKLQDQPRRPASGNCHQSVAATAHNLIDPEAFSSPAVSLTSRNVSLLPENPNIPWPGVETVMESYQRHKEEQLAESQILRERCHQLQASHHNLAQVATRINSHMTYLMEERQRLQEERLRHQDNISHLKETLNHLK